MTHLRAARRIASAPIPLALAGASLAALSLLLAARAEAQSNPPNSAGAQPSGTAAPAAAGPAPSVTLDEIDVISQRLNQARIGIEPRIGASTYTLSPEAIQDLPGGKNTPIDDVILQMPGVDQDNLANGGLHVRNEHLNVQYRVNGVTLPDGVSFFGQDLSTRLVDSMELITGALPAQYGLRTAGIIDIQTKATPFKPGGAIEMNGGSYGTINPSVEYAGSVGGYNYFIQSDYLQSDHGINGVTPKYNQIHDHTLQTHDFAYLEKILDPNSKISMMIGEFNGQFQIPNNPGQPTFGGITAINGVPISAFDSTKLTEHQTEGSQFGAISYLRSEGDLDFQISDIVKYSALHFHPDGLGDLAFNGISQNAARSSLANNLQAEGTYRLTPDHTLRGGILYGVEHVNSKTNSNVLAQIDTDAFGNPIFDTTTTDIFTRTEKTSYSYSAYLQDEWKALETVTVNYGARFDLVDGYTHGDQVSPRVNVVWQATPSTTVHAGYAKYFTPPPQELVQTGALAAFANTSGAPPGTTNDPIRNETAHYLDAGVIQELFPGLKAGVDLYYKYSHHLLDEGQFGAPIVLTPFNYHHAINRGIELTSNYVNGDFTYYGNLAIAEQRAKGIESAEFNFSPDDLFIAQNTYVHTDHSQVLTASAGVAYTWYGTRYAVDILAGSGLRTVSPGDISFNGGTVPSYEQVNLSATHRFENAPGGPITVRLAVINLFDEIYLLRSQTGVGEFANQYGPRRSVFASIKKEF